MTTDPTTLAGLVAREVRSGSREGSTTKIVVARRDYPADRADLWDVLTNPERIPRWFMPVEGDLVVGGKYQVVGNAGGVIERCDAPDSFAVTWEMGPTVSWLTVTLTPAADGTTLELVHEAPVDPGMWEQFGPGAVGVGWDLALSGLGRALVDESGFDPAEAIAWPTTPEGVAFVTAASTDWAEASVRDGADPEQAHGAAARTTEFYTVEPETGSDG